MMLAVVFSKIFSHKNTHLNVGLGRSVLKCIWHIVEKVVTLETC